MSNSSVSNIALVQIMKYEPSQIWKPNCSKCRFQTNQLQSQLCTFWNTTEPWVVYVSNKFPIGMVINLVSPPLCLVKLI